MSGSDAEPISNEEAFETSYHTFIRCLEALASSPEAACKQYGHYNVAWEIKEDVSAGVFLKNNSAHRLSEQHVTEIKRLAEILNSLPASAIPFSNIVEESLKNMRHPAWELPRRMASQLLESLRPVTETNEKYFSQ